MYRRQLLGRAIAAGGLVSLPWAAGCTPAASPATDALSNYRADCVWGRLGLADGRFQKPRAMAIDARDQLYIVDKTGRIQVFDTDGNYRRGWRTPAIETGKPTGLSVHRDGSLMVADTHYFRILFYTPEGDLQADRTIGGSLGPDIGQFAFVTDCVHDAEGNYYISEYGQFDRIQKYGPDGRFICRFGSSGQEPMQFSRPQSLAIDREQRLWIADACNHRLQIVRCPGDKPELVEIIGGLGDGPGQFRYPYGLWLTDDHFYVVEYGNHRVQKLARLGGSSRGWWGEAGRLAGQLNQPWSMAIDSQGRAHVIDSQNHRVQRFIL